MAENEEFNKVIMINNKELKLDLKIRHQKVQKVMKEKGIEACVLATGVNIFYMTGCIYNGCFYLPVEGEPIHFVKRPTGISFDNTIYIRKPEQITEILQERGLRLPSTVMLEVDVISLGECTRLMNALNVQNPANASVLMRQIRSIKTAFEIKQIRGCARRHEAVYREIPSLFKRGMTDLELQIDIERSMRKHGSLGLFRTYGECMDIHMGSLLVGDNAAVGSPFDFALGGAGSSPALPLGSCGQLIEEGQTIMADMAGNYSPWVTDMTRVFSVGKVSDLAYKAHDVSREIEELVMSTAKPGTSCADLYNISMDLVKKYKLEPYYMGTEQQAKFVGHGLGLEINEPPVLTPRSREVLEPNIVFAVEPKFVIPGVGAVGIENTLLVKEDGIEKITLLEESIIEL